MRRVFLIIVLFGVGLLAVGVVVVGAFPPHPTPQPIQKVLPNDRFQKAS